MPPASVSSQYTRTGKWKWAAGAPESGSTRSVIGRRDDKAPAPAPAGRGDVRVEQSPIPVAAGGSRRGLASGQSPPSSPLLARLLVDRAPDRMAGLRVRQRERRIGRPRGAEFGLAGADAVAGAVDEGAQ